MQAKTDKAVAIGINHVAIEVGDIDQALDFYGALLTFKLRGRNETMAFIDLGDQFLNLSTGRSQTADTRRHFGLVVINREAMRPILKRLKVTILDSPGLDFLDPWGNYVQVVEYRGIQFTKADQILRGMGLYPQKKSAEALKELANKGMSVH